jgi:integrase
MNMDNITEFERYYNILDTQPLPPKLKKRGHGEGSISKVGDKWCGRITVGKSADGKQIRKRVQARTKAELMTKMREAVANFKPEEYTPIDRSPTLHAWLLTYIKTYKGKSAPATIKKYNSYINAVGNSPIGTKKLNDITPLELQDFINTFATHSVTRKALGFIREAFATAVNVEACRKNPALFLANTKEKTAPKFKDGGKAFTLEEERRFVNYIKDNKYKLLYIIILYAGLRRGEVCALRGTDIDLDQRLIRVNTAIRKAYDGGYEQGKTKTENAVRAVPMTSELYEILKNEKIPQGYLVTAMDGGVLNPDVLTADFGEVMKNMCITHTLYHLRHTYGTRLHAKGIDDKIIALWMGHSSEKVTQEHYIHATPDMIADALKLI